MERSAAVWTLFVAVALLLERLESAVAAITVAVFVITAPSFAVTWTIRPNVADPTGNVAAVAVLSPLPPTLGSVSKKARPEGWLNETNVVPLRTPSARPTPAAVSGPPLGTAL